MDEYFLRLNEEEQTSLEKIQEKFGFEEINKVKEAGPVQPQENLNIMKNRSAEQRFNLDRDVENKIRMDAQQALVQGGKELVVPKDEELYGEYNKEKFQEKSLFKSRESKIKNVNSRLYRKNQNASKMAAFEEKELKERDLRAKLRRNMEKTQRFNMTTQQAKDVSELAMLLGEENETEEQIKARMETLTEQMSGVDTAEAVTKEANRRSALATIEAFEKMIEEGKPIEVVGVDGKKTIKKEPLTEREKKQLEDRILAIKEDQLQGAYTVDLEKEKATVKSTEKSVNDLRTEIEKLDREIAKGNEKKADNEEQLRNETVSLNEARTMLKNIEDIVSSHKKAVEAKEKKVTDTEKEIKNLEKKIKSFGTEDAALDAELKKVLRVKKENLRIDKADLKDMKKLVAEMLKPYEVDIAQKKKDIADSEKKVNKIQKELEDLAKTKEKRNKKQADLDKAEAKLAEHTELRDKMQDHADMIERRYESVRAEKKKEHEESRKAGHAQILNETVKAIMKIDVSGINLFDDAQLADCQTVLERNRKLVDIYRRMSAEHPDFEKSLENRRAFRKQLDYLTAVSDLYRVRKLIVTNEYYKTHYNDELSMETDVHDTPAKKYLARLLRTSFYLGKNLQMATEKRTGKEHIAAHPVSLTARNKRSVRDDDMGRRMSADPADWAELQTIKELEKTGYMDLDAAAVQKEYKILEKNRRTYTDNMLYTLEFEKDCVPNDDEIVDLDKLANTKLTARALMYDSYIGENSTLMANLEQRDPKYRKRVRKYFKLKDDKKIATSEDPGVKSKRFRNFHAGDSLNRSQYLLTMGSGEHMTDEENLEFIENMLHSYMKPAFGQFSEEEQAAAEEMFLSEYKTYIEQIYAGSKWVMNVLGSAAPFLHPEDLVKLLSNEKFRRKIITQATASTNLQNEGPLQFMKTFKKDYYGHMDDFDPVCMSAGALMIMINQIKAQVMGPLQVDYRAMAKFEAIQEQKIAKIDDAIGKAQEERQSLNLALEGARQRYEAAPEHSQDKKEQKTSMEMLEKQIYELDEKLDQLEADKEYESLAKDNSNREHSMETFDMSMLHKKIYAPGEEDAWEGKDYWYKHMGIETFYNNFVPDYMIFRDTENCDIKMYTEEEKKKYLDSLKSRGIYDMNKKLREGYEKLTLEQRKKGIDKNDKTWDEDTKEMLNTAIKTSRNLTNSSRKAGSNHAGNNKFVQKSFYD